jgi:asparagine synthase (glutamine-hydrolysing)
MMAANSVEGRFPFLDHRVVDFAARLPSRLKIRGLREKHILKKSAQGFLPAPIVERHKQPYRAPIHSALFVQPPEYVEHLLSTEALRANGVLDPEPVGRLLRKAEVRETLSEFEEMALVGALSTQLLYDQFIDNFDVAVPGVDPVRICRGEELVR